VLSTFGYWQVFGGIADNGSPVCGLRTGWAGGTQGFIVKWFSGLELIVHIYKSTWNVPEGRQVDLQFQFDHAAPWFGKAAGTKNPNLVEVRIPPDRVDSFLNEVRYANTLYVAFPSGTEAPWSGAMAGSSAGVTGLLQCVHVTNAQMAPTPAPTPSQPYAIAPHPAPSQPYSTPVRGSEI